jgi:hypothetical protein
MIALSLVGFQLETLLRKPAVENLLLLGLFILLAAAAVIWCARRFRAGALRRGDLQQPAKE